MNYHPYIDALSALLTPLIAVIAAYVAYQQYRANKLKLQSELYDRRLKIFHMVNDFIIAMYNARESPDQHISKLRRVQDDSYFLFGADIQEYLETLRRKAYSLQRAKRDILPASDEDKLELEEEIEDSAYWFLEQQEKSKRKFAKYLRMNL